VDTPFKKKKCKPENLKFSLLDGGYVVNNRSQVQSSGFRGSVFGGSRSKPFGRELRGRMNEGSKVKGERK
jgi:hypothetical protein